jgi:polyvinyl alcohol dehydrogenase (cytochrome)
MLKPVPTHVSVVEPAAWLRAIGILLACATCGWAQPSDGARVFQQTCATCHTGASDSRAPSLDALRARTPQAVIDSLLTGAMRPQGARLSGAERRAVAEFITGKSIDGDVTGARVGRCAAPAPLRDPASAPQWSGWSPAPSNTRFQPAADAGLTASDLPRLRLKWAFGFPDASVAWAQPTLAGGRVFVGSQNGTVYSLDAKTGCVRWTFAASGGVRTAIAIGPGGSPSRPVAYFGDTGANAYALDADTGERLWVRRVDDHPSARITGSPTLHEGRLYVPVASYEEAQGADPQYPCCTFRGSLVALDAVSGAVIWKTYMIAEAAERRGTSSAGVPLWGPSVGIWSAPTVDPARRAVYVATGNAYSAPATASSDAVVALDLATGAIRWVRQVTANDVYVSNCRAGNPNCPDALGPDHDFGSPPVLAHAAGRDLIVIGQKSGIAFAMDLDRNGEVLWQYRAGRGGTLGGIEWGAAVDAERAYFAVSDITTPQPGGLHAVSLATGTRAWFTPPAAPACGSGRGCNAAQSAAVTAIPGAVFSGSNDGSIRAYSTATGEILWQFDTNREFNSVNGVPARGASIIGPGAAIAGGMVFVNSGYGAFGGRPGNVLLAFGPE